MCSLPVLQNSHLETAPDLQYIGRRKCGDVSISLDVKNVILHCIFCEFANENLEIFFNHLRSNHLSKLSKDIMQMKQSEDEIQVKQELIEEEATIPQQCALMSNIEINSPITEAANLKTEANDLFVKLKTVGCKLETSEIKPLCVFCFKNNGTLMSFTETTLRKCKYILIIRQSNNLAMKDSKVPLALNDFQKYHSKCYRLFTAMSRKYRAFLSSALTNCASSSEGDMNNFLPNTSEYPAVEIEGILTDTFTSMDDGNQSTFAYSIKPETEDHVQNIACVPVTSVYKEYVCIFCQKKRKKHRSNDQQLITLTKDDLLKNLKCNALEMGDLNLFKRVNEICSNNDIILYHKICKLNYSNALKTQITAKCEKKQWHVSRDIHKQAFQEVCNFVLENVVKGQQCFFLSFLKSLFVDFAKNQNIQLFTAGIEPHNFDSKLLAEFPRKINIITIKHKKVVKPCNRFLFDNDLEALEKQDVLERAVLILRSEIRNFQRNSLSNKLRSNLIKEEYNVTKLPGDLEIAVKSLTNANKIIQILNKNMHSCYYAQDELKTNATFTSIPPSDVSSEYLRQPRNQALEYNNSDRFVGNDTLLKTVGIIFQNIEANIHTKDYFENTEENEFASLKKRRKTVF